MTPRPEGSGEGVAATIDPGEDAAEPEGIEDIERPGDAIHVHGDQPGPQHGVVMVRLVGNDVSRARKGKCRSERSEPAGSERFTPGYDPSRRASPCLDSG